MMKVMFLYIAPIESEYLSPLCFTTIPCYHGDTKSCENQMFQVMMMCTWRPPKTGGKTHSGSDKLNIKRLNFSAWAV
jgi:hypothetical protein